MDPDNTSDLPLLIVGLGNPGPKYEITRHNLGFWLVDELAERWSAPPFTSRCQALYSKATIGGQRVVLAKPQTFMNLSGQSVACLLRELDLTANDDQLWVAHDDIDMDRFMLRLRRGGGGHGGHNGLRSLFSTLGSQDFSRIKIGVGRPPGRQQVADYVLEIPGKKELEEYAILIDTAADAVEYALRAGLDAAMNEYNQRGGAAE